MCLLWNAMHSKNAWFYFFLVFVLVPHSVAFRCSRILCTSGCQLFQYIRTRAPSENSRTLVAVGSRDISHLTAWQLNSDKMKITCRQLSWVFRLTVFISLNLFTRPLLVDLFASCPLPPLSFSSLISALFSLYVNAAFRGKGIWVKHFVRDGTCLWSDVAVYSA